MHRRRWRRIWFQVHVWLGLALGMVVTVVCLTGSVLVYRTELERALHPEWYAPPSPRAASPERVLQVVRTRYPHAVVLSLQPVKESTTWIVLVQDAQFSLPAREVFVSGDLPARVLGERPANTGLIQRTYQLHRDLLLGSTGRTLNGILALALVLLEITGLLLWWPIPHRWRAAIRFRGRADIRRAAWDTHLVVGLWTLAPLLLFAVTGYRFCFPKAFTVPAAIVLGEDIHGYEQFFRRTIRSGSQPSEAACSLDSLMLVAETQCPLCRTRRIQLPVRPRDPVEVFMQAGSYEQMGGFQSYFFDRWSGRLIASTASREAPASVQAIFIESALHFGRWGGQASRLFSVASGTAPAGLYATGLFLWLRRWRRSSRLRVRPSSLSEHR